MKNLFSVLVLVFSICSCCPKADDHSPVDTGPERVANLFTCPDGFDQCVNDLAEMLQGCVDETSSSIFASQCGFRIPFRDQYQVTATPGVGVDIFKAGNENSVSSFSVTSTATGYAMSIAPFSLNPGSSLSGVVISNTTTVGILTLHFLAEDLRREGRVDITFGGKFGTNVFAVTDQDGDGNSDLVVGDNAGNYILVFLNEDGMKGVMELECPEVEIISRDGNQVVLNVVWPFVGDDEGVQKEFVVEKRNNC